MLASASLTKNDLQRFYFIRASSICGTDHASSYNHQPVVTKATGDSLRDSTGLWAVRRSKEEGGKEKGAADNPSNQTYPQTLSKKEKEQTQ